MSDPALGRSGMHGAEVAAWQRFLTGRGFYRGRITGDYDSQTRDATIKFQERYGLGADGIVGPQTVEQARRLGFVVPTGRPDRDHYTARGGVDLPPELRQVVKEVAYHYYLWTGESFRVTSGKRTPERQAEAMYNNRRSGKLAHYKDQIAFQEILEAYAREEPAGASQQEIVEAMAGVIAQHPDISRHLSGRAFDVSMHGKSHEQVAAFMEAVKEVFGSVGNHMPEDPRKAGHLHVQF
jgi:peptidoglycan hydrolase-like protein with peptidoglycan-binding domain